VHYIRVLYNLLPAIPIGCDPLISKIAFGGFGEPTWGILKQIYLRLLHHLFKIADIARMRLNVNKREILDT